jgi:hypothetical protein
VADLPYTDASNQQSYQQLLWKTFCRRENYQTLLGGGNLRWVQVCQSFDVGGAEKKTLCHATLGIQKACERSA